MNNLPGPKNLITQPVDAEITLFRLYIAAGTHASARAVLNLQIICDDYFPNSHKTEIVDILSEPLRALSEGILLTPTLIRLAPMPRCSIVGDLSEITAVLFTLGLKHRADR